MPPITLHMVLASNLAKNLSREELISHDGWYLLGATTPDIRVITKQNRQDTHFFDLSVMEHQDSVELFIRSTPSISDPGSLNTQARAFIAGYISHLSFDESYITNVYRPNFLNSEQIGSSIKASLMDRLLQFDLDRTYSNDPQLRTHLCEALSFTINDIKLGFIEIDTLRKWRDVVSDITARNLDWDRARSMINNHLRNLGVDDDGELAIFLDSLPDLLNETIGYVTSEEVHSFVERATEEATLVVGKYLQCV